MICTTNKNKNTDRRRVQLPPDATASELDNDMILAAREGAKERVQEALSAGANPSRLHAHGLSPFHEAAQRGHIDVLKVLAAAKNASVNGQDRDGLSPLHWAAARGHDAAAKYLISVGAMVNAKDADGMVPLHWASAKGRAVLVETLISNGCHVGAKDRDGRTALHWAAAKGQKAVITKLLTVSTHADRLTGEAATEKAERGKATSMSSSGPLATLRRLTGGLTGGGSPRTSSTTAAASSSSSSSSSSGAPPVGAPPSGSVPPAPRPPSSRKKSVTPTPGSSLGGKAAANRILDPDAADHSGQTAIHLAAQFGHSGAVKALLDGRVDVQAADKEGNTALQHAAYNGKLDVVQLLLDAGLRANITNEEGTTPLHRAAFQAESAVVKLLLAKGAAAHVKGKGGDAPLHWAASNSSPGSIEVVRLLLTNSADATAKNDDGVTALHVAAGKNNVFIMSALLEAGALIDAEDNERRTPLHIAAGRGKVGAVALLLDEGASSLKRDATGLMAVEVAARAGQTQVTELFKSRQAELDAIKAQAQRATSGGSGVARRRSSLESYVSMFSVTSLGKKEEEDLFDFSRYGSVSIGIGETELRKEKNGSKFTSYMIEVRADNVLRLVPRRFREFRALDKLVRQALPKSNLPVLPGRKLFGSLSPHVVEDRLVTLERYLRTLAASKSVQRTEAFRQFLTGGQPSLLRDDDDDEYGQYSDEISEDW